jgi:hypothetical protein
MEKLGRVWRRSDDVGKTLKSNCRPEKQIGVFYWQSRLSSTELAMHCAPFAAAGKIGGSQELVSSV